MKDRPARQISGGSLLAAVGTSLFLRFLVQVHQDGVLWAIALVALPVAAVCLFGALAYRRSQRARERRAVPGTLFTGPAKRPVHELAPDEGAKLPLAMARFVDGELVVAEGGLHWIPSDTARRAGISDVDVSWGSVRAVRITSPRGLWVKVWKLELEVEPTNVNLVVFGRPDLARALRRAGAPVG